MSAQHPIKIETIDGEHVDWVGNAETATSVLYGDLYYHPGSIRVITLPTDPAWDYEASILETEARINADCWAIPVDIIRRRDL